MNSGFLAERERGLENEFFYRVDQKLRQQLREKMRAEQRVKALRDATGITDDSVIEELAGVGFSSETLLALSLVPLVRVAWADGHIDDEEKAAVLQAAESVGHAADSPSYRLLEAWLDVEPEEAVFKAWKDYVQALSGTISKQAKETLQRDLCDRARSVAEAAGGILGLHRVSHSEEVALAELERVFAQA